MTLMRTAVIAIAVGLAGCATESTDGADATFPADALATIHSDRGLSIEVRTSPGQPPSRGESSVELRVSGAHDEPVDGLLVDAEPWMPAMGHGASTQPERTDEGEGRYRFDKVDLFMPGEWELRLTFSGEMSDRATARFQIP